MKSNAAFLAVLMLVSGIIPFAVSPARAEASSTNVPVGVYTNHLDDEDEDEEEDEEDDDDDDDDDRRSVRFSSRSRDGYSSTVRRAVERLDRDEVDEMPIPVLMGVRVANLWPNFGDPRDGGARSHEGLDIMAPKGAWVASPTDAVVVRTGEGSSSGIFVTTANPGGETFNYYHLDDIADGIKAGKVLEPGDLIGYVGNTGNARGGADHLHFEIRENRRAKDPFPRLTEEFSSQIRIKVLTEILKELQAELKRVRD